MYIPHENNPTRRVSPPIGLITNLSPDTLKYPIKNKYHNNIDSNNKYYNNLNYQHNM